MNHLQQPDAVAVRRIVESALAEDAPWGDITSETLIPSGVQATARLRAREAGIFCGEAVIRTSLELAHPDVQVDFLVHDGDKFAPGAELAVISGDARAILRAERIALNLSQRLSGIATLTGEFVAAVAGSAARIVDTRKTTPGLRVLERFAVRCGGGHNHRFSLSDAVMAKDNHLAILTAGGGDLTQELIAARGRLPHTVHFEVEVDRLDQVEPVLAAGVDTIMLDNFTLEDLVKGVDLIGGRAVVEASGNVRLETVGAIARTGVDVISSGALTHSARALDLGLDIEIQTPVRP